MESNTNNNSKEFDLLAIIRHILNNKLSLIVWLVLFTILGITYALNKEKSYTATVTLAPEATSMGMSQGLSSIAGSLGIDLASKKNDVDAIYPEIYPEIFASSDFIIKLFDIPVLPKDSTTYKSYYKHIVQDHKIPFWTYYIESFINNFQKKEKEEPLTEKVNPTRLTKQQNKAYEQIRHNIECQLNKGTNLINISVTDVDPQIAATIADTLQQRLQQYITAYRTKKARKDYNYAEKLNNETKLIYIKAREAYSEYADANTDVTLETIKAKLEDLENEMQLKYNNYTQTQQQMLQAKERIQENTPAFTIIQQATIPLKPSSTPRTFMVLGFIITGLFVDVIWIFFIKDSIVKFISKFHIVDKLRRNKGK